MRNTLYYGDNLPILRDHIKDESVDLVYLDPPFNSSRTYNVLFKDESGSESEAQIAAFEDTWHWIVPDDHRPKLWTRRTDWALGQTWTHQPLSTAANWNRRLP